MKLFVMTILCSLAAYATPVATYSYFAGASGAAGKPLTCAYASIPDTNGPVSSATPIREKANAGQGQANIVVDPTTASVTAQTQF